MAEVDGPAAALALVDDLDLPGYHRREAVGADLLRRLDRPGEALAAYDAAIAACRNDAERALLRGRRPELVSRRRSP